MARLPADSVDPARGPLRATVDMPLRWVAVGTALVIALFAATAFGLDAYGRGRVSLPPATEPLHAVVATSGPAAIDTMQSAGIRGAHLIQAAEVFGYRNADFESLVSTDAEALARPFPPTLANATDEFRSLSTSSTYLYIATRLGIARRVDHLISETSFERRVESARTSGLPLDLVDAGTARSNIDGDIRYIYTALPEIDEPVAVLVCASFFTYAAPDELVAELKRALPDIRMCLVSLDEGTSGVDDTARDRAREFARLVNEGALR